MHNKRSLRCHVAVTHTLLQVTSAMGVNEQLLLSELRQTRADVNSGPHRLIAHPVMRALWHDFFSSEHIDCATF